MTPQVHRGDGMMYENDAGGINRWRRALNLCLLPRCRLFRVVINYMVKCFLFLSRWSGAGADMFWKSSAPQHGFQEWSVNTSVVEAAGARLTEFFGE